MLGPVEVVVAGVVVVNAISCVGFGLGTLLKAQATKGLIDQARKKVEVVSDMGRRVTIFVDEFIYEDGSAEVELSVREHEDGQAYVLTAAESEILAKTELLDGLVDSEVTMSSKGWKSVIQPLLGAVNSRMEEIRKSPGRVAQ